MSTVGFKVNAVLTALAITATVGASAAPLTGAAVTGYAVPIIDTGGGVLAPAALNSGNVAIALGGNAAAPGGNLQLGLFGGMPVGVLSGMGGGHTFTLSSLTSADWTVAFATQYIQDASVAAFGFQLNSGQLTVALTNFFNLDISGHKPWELVSDPNVSYVDFTGTTLSVGLAGLLNASPFLSGISGIPLPAGKQASEVVKVSIDGGAAQYLYGFSATPSGVTLAGDPSRTVFSGNYDVKINGVPEPAGLALFGIGLFGLLATRRRTS